MNAQGAALLALIFVILAGLLLVSSTDLVLMEREVNVLSLSVIIPDENDDCWGNFKKGMERAAIEFNADLSFVTLYERARADQQAELMLRELENGAQALIVCPADSEILAAGLENGNLTAPVVALNSPTGIPQERAFIAADLFYMGGTLATSVRVDQRSLGISEVIAVSVPGKRYDIDETLAGLTSGLGGSGIKLNREYILTDRDAENLLEAYKPEEGQVLVALDSSSMQLLSTKVRRLPEERRALYGVGCTNSILRGLEEGAIRAIAVADDYNAGYLSVKAAVDILERTENGARYTLGTALIRREDMYIKEHEMILFPIM